MSTLWNKIFGNAHLGNIEPFSGKIPVEKKVIAKHVVLKIILYHANDDSWHVSHTQKVLARCHMLIVSMIDPALSADRISSAV